MSKIKLTPTLDFEGKVVLVTGGTGSFGQKFVEILINEHNPSKIIIFSRDELKQFEMRGKPQFRDVSCLRFFIGDVRDLDRLEMAFREVDYVIHAAALKRIDTAEYNPFECIQTNVYGAENIVKAAIRTSVRLVIALSTDKAANPINLYGASKLASDKIFVAAKWLVGSSKTPLFAVVRYGNVIGSRGSVVPLYQRLIDEKVSSLPITDPRMTRFWITLDQGVRFVLSSFSYMRGGEIFVPKIPSMRITDLAESMAPGIKTHNIGIRPGEKLHEAMITEDEARLTLELPDRYVISTALFEKQYGYHKEEILVPDNFRYASDNNSNWLSIDEMRVMIETIGNKVC